MEHPFHEILDELYEQYEPIADAHLPRLVAKAFCDASELDVLTAKYFSGMGIDYFEVGKIAGPISVHTVWFDGVGFDFDLWGGTALVMIVNGFDGVTPVDLVAWSVGNPKRFATFYGAGAVLGADHLNPPALDPLPIFRTPLGWLMSGCQGLCILSASRARTILVRHPGRFLAEDRSHAEALLQRLSPPLTADRVVFRRQFKGKAAA